MTIRKKSFLIASLTLIALIIVLYIVTDGILRRGFEVLEREIAQQNAERVRGIIGQEIENLAAKASDWSNWDDMYAYAATPNAKFIETNVDDQVLPVLGVNILAFINTSGTILYEHAVDGAGHAIPLPFDFVPSLLRINEGSVKSGIVMSSYGPILVIMKPILTTQQTGPSRGTLIWARFLDDALMQNLREMSLLDLKLIGFSDPTVADSVKQKLGDTYPVPLIEIATDQELKTYSVYMDIFGERAFIVQADMERTLFAYGRMIARYVIIALIAVGLASILLYHFLVNRLILKRLFHLMSQMSAIERTGDFSIRFSLSGNDELSQMVHTANRAMNALESTQREKLRAEAQLRLAQAQLSHSQKLEAIGQLAAGIAHEINTPAQYVSDNVRFLKEAFQSIQVYYKLSCPCPQEFDHDIVGSVTDSLGVESKASFFSKEIPVAITQALEGLERISTIVKAMRDFSHPSTSEKVIMDINRSIEGAVVVARNEWKYVAELEFDLDRQLPMVMGYPAEFNQALLNIVINAAYAIEAALPSATSTAKGRIAIGSRRVGQWAEIRIEDTGIGIPESIRARIFEPFFTTKSIGNGTGQGLHFAYKTIVDLHGGELSFDSQVGKGTVFSVRLPITTTSTV